MAPDDDDTTQGQPDDPIDERGHTVADAKATQPNLDVEAPAATEETPTGKQIVRAQTAEEVEAQIKGRGPDDDDEDDEDDE